MFSESPGASSAVGVGIGGLSRGGGRGAALLAAAPFLRRSSEKGALYAVGCRVPAFLGRSSEVFCLGWRALPACSGGAARRLLMLRLHDRSRAPGNRDDSSASLRAKREEHADIIVRGMHWGR